ncbi:MAG: CoA-binding protein [bacterium]
MGDMSSESCPMPRRDQDELVRTILGRAQTVAIVGMSPNPDRPSHEVGLYLRQYGYIVIPVHPKAKEIAGLQAYPDLDAIPADQGVDIATLFVAGERTGPIIEQVARTGAKVVYFQPGAENAASEERARELGLQVFSGRCIMADHTRLIRS